MADHLSGNAGRATARGFHPLHDDSGFRPPTRMSAADLMAVLMASYLKYDFTTRTCQ